MQATPTPDVNGPDEADIARKVDAELLAVGYRTIAISAPTQCFGACVLAAVVWRADLALAVGIWLVAVLAANLLRTIDARRFAASGPEAGFEARWRRRFLAGPLVTGILWGIAGAVFLPAVEPERNPLVLVILIGGGATSAYTLASVRGAFERFSLPMIAPIVGFAAMSRTSHDLLLASLACVFWAVMRGMTDRLRAASAAVLVMRVRNDALLEATSRAKRLLEERNAALQESEERFREFTRLSSDWLWQQDESLRFTKIDGAVQLGRRYVGSHLGRRRWDIPYLEPLDGAWDDHRKVIERREPFKDFVMRWRASDGAMHFVSVSGRPRFDAAGRFVGYYGTAKDVTDLKRAEETAADLRVEAASASEAKANFLANVTHELHTPMNGVLGTLDLLGDTQLDAEQRRLLDLAVASGQSLLELIDEVLEFSRLERPDALAPHNAPFVPRPIIESAVARVRTRADAKGLHLEAQVDAGVPQRMIGDGARFARVLGILLGNAIKFTERGGVRVALAAEPIPLNAQRIRLRLTVADTGVGIDPAVRERLFAPFTQGDASAARKFGGTGLGLAIARRLVDAMGGVITVESEPGAGATFAVIVPLAMAADAPPVMTQPMMITGHKVEPIVARVLLVEDNPVNREVALSMLTRLGVRTVIATDGLEAIAAVRRERFDVILMDCQMPGMDGFAATAAIRALESATNGPRTPIVALTANTAEADRDRCIAAGMDDHLGKPFKRSALAEKLLRYTAGAPPAGA